MRRTTTALLAAAMMAGVGGAEAQERENGSWWRPAVLSLVDGVSQTVSGEDDRPRWTRTGRTDTDGRAEDRTRTDRDDRAEREDGRDRDGWTRRGEARRDEDRDDDRYESRERYEDRGRDARADRGRGARKGGGPPFCRNGQGHPVHGWQWCVEKGWAGQSYDRYESRDRRDRRDGGWTRTSWEDVIFRGPTTTTRDRRIGQRTVADILGDVVLGRLAEHGRRTGLGGEIDARWVPLPVGSVLQLRMGGLPLAELTDRDRDGRADVVLLRR